MENLSLDEAQKERERQRTESEARSIIHDLDRLYTFPEERKSRWVWELLQNAKDVADTDGVEICFRLTDTELIFGHNGKPFKTKHLLAILYKTSTKSLNGEDGTTGKYGTGFVTTHLLNKKVAINGVHENDLGKRRFELEIDRSAASLEESKALVAMQESLAKTFANIGEITKKAPEEIASNWHTFTYKLTAESRIYAEKGLIELERNIAFTLLINSRIKKVTIDSGISKSEYMANSHPTNMEGIEYVASNSEQGLLFHKSEKLTFGLPATKLANDSYRLLPIDNQAVLFKEFPLIGTERFNLPVFIQHTDFHPTELRDGIRTKKSSEGDDDPIADKNRNALIEFVVAYLPFAQTLITAEIDNLHFIAKSGLPEFADRFTNIVWYEQKVQNVIRNFVLDKSIVKSCSGSRLKIAEAKFPSFSLYKNEAFYSLVSTLLPGIVPEIDSVWEWCEIIFQESNSWPDNIFINDEELVKSVSTNLNSNEESCYEWLKTFYDYLEENKLSHWGERYPIYLNEANNFCLRDKVSVYPDIDDEVKVVSKGLGRSLDDEFLNRKLGKVVAIKAFELTEFYNYLNKDLISELQIVKATAQQINAVFHMCSLFRSEKASKRERWFLICRQLLPTIVPEKKLITIDYENFGRSAEFWTLKYICSLIEKAQKPTVFAAQYFDGNGSSCFEWLKDFLVYVFDRSEENNEVVLKRQIIPTEADTFSAYDDKVFAEEQQKHFDETIKNIYRNHTKGGDPRKFIIDRRVVFEGLRAREVDILTKDIDKIFQDPNIEVKIKKGGPLNEMFLELNNWFEQFINVASGFLPTFHANRNSLYVLALGDGFSKQIMDLRNSGRSMEDITELANSKLTNKEIKQFESAAEILGADKLLRKVQDMLDSKEEKDRWRRIGGAAETAFEEAISNLDFEFEILNPDLGKDFELIVNAMGYSIEIKSVVEGKENVRMSILQGRTAVAEKDNYALCVMTRPNDSENIDKTYFIENSRFVMDIGYQIGDKIKNWDEGLQTLDVTSEIKVFLDSKTESVYVNRNIWKGGIPFTDFIGRLNEIFAGNEIDR